jgi:hypothetical protein
MKEPKINWMDGYKLECSSCHKDVLYWRFSVPSVPWPFFYCEQCNNILHDLAQFPPAPPFSENCQEQLRRLEAYWNTVLGAAPPCPCGGRFTFWANVKCPHCWYEFPYGGGMRNNIDLRINEHYIIAVDGAIILHGDSSLDWKARIRVAEDAGSAKGNE